MLTVSADHCGTPESVWTAWTPLTGAPELPQLDGRLLVVAPHPDDEVLGAAGLMLRAARTGAIVEIVAVTDGEASHPGTRDRRALGAHRRRERDRALRCLGLAPRVHHLEVPDGRVAEHEAQVLERLRALLGPRTTCVGPWRLDGHPDHDAVARAVISACRATGAALVEYPIWGWHWATPDAGLAREHLRRLVLPPADRARKSLAIAQFASQVRPLDEAPDDPVVLPAAVLSRFERPFETYLVGVDG